MPTNARLTADDILTSSGKYPERAIGATVGLCAELRILAERINRVLDAIGYTGPVKVSSGYRPKAANAAAGGAPMSAHMTGSACDFETQAIGLAIRAHPKGAEALRKEGLFMEALESTKGNGIGWVHIDKRERPDRPNREFKP